jgi:BirA family biotin operon repressor/biotin-[acetyl-CoA-carboxylase] ligase
MKSPLANAKLVSLGSVDSTQTYAGDLLKGGERIGGVLALEQKAGRGRFGRTWHSPSGDCLAVSLVFTDSIGHPRPYLLGMGLAVACAQAFECSVQWPNDVVYQNRKLGGILTELLPNDKGESVPVVGVGVNLNQANFPSDIAEFATSIRLANGCQTTPLEALTKILQRFSALPELVHWSDLEPIWMPLDTTMGKRYKLRDGQEAIANGIGLGGELLCEVDGAEYRALAADALLGP